MTGSRRVPIAGGSRQFLRRVRWFLVPAVALACASGLTACGRKGAAAVPTATVAAVSTPPVSSNCASSAAGGTTGTTMKVQGRDRTVLVHVPSGYRGNRPTPLVLNLHGSGSTAAEQEAFSGMDVTSDANGFLVAYPQAVIPDGSGFDWNVPGVPLVGGSAVPAGSANDVTFLEDVVYTLEARYCVNPQQVYVTGMSGGGRMASQLGCDASNLFAAVAPVAGLRLPAPCPSVRSVPVIAFHGTADPVDPYDGIGGQAYWTYSVPVAAQRWAAHDGCSSQPTVSESVTGAKLTAYGQCTGGAAVELYSLSGEGHEWPGGPHVSKVLSAVLGPQFPGLSADAVMWRFFESHPLP